MLFREIIISVNEAKKSDVKNSTASHDILSSG